MIAPQHIIRSHPKRPRESDQGYAMRLLKVALEHWTGNIYDAARTIAITEGARAKNPEAENMANNIAIEIEQQKILVIEALHLPGGPVH